MTETYFVIPVELFLIELESMANLFINDVKSKNVILEITGEKSRFFRQPESTCTVDLKEILFMCVEFTRGFHSCWTAQRGLLTLI